ncbi:MAG: phosphatase PAP2 family protein [Acidobacteriota bacterium]
MSVRGLLVASAILAALAALAIVTIDEPAARWLGARDTWPAAWNTGIAWFEYGAGIEPWRWAGVVALAVLAAGCLALRRVELARAFVYIDLVHLASRLLMMWMKTATGRLRPWEWLRHAGATFGQGGASFPSGHVMIFASLALPAAVVWPRLRWLAIAVTAYACLARLAVDAHFVSDVLAGAALASAITALLAPIVRWPTPAASRR